MKRYGVAFGWLLFGCSAGGAALEQTPETERIDRGKEVYRVSRCAMCHSIEGKGNKKNPLDGVGSRLEADSVRKWIVSPREMNPKVSKRAYDKLSKVEPAPP